MTLRRAHAVCPLGQGLWVLVRGSSDLEPRWDRRPLLPACSGQEMRWPWGGGSSRAPAPCPLGCLQRLCSCAPPEVWPLSFPRHSLARREHLHGYPDAWSGGCPHTGCPVSLSTFWVLASPQRASSTWAPVTILSDLGLFHCLVPRAVLSLAPGTSHLPPADSRLVLWLCPPRQCVDNERLLLLGSRAGPSGSEAWAGSHLCAARLTFC